MLGMCRMPAKRALDAGSGDSPVKSRAYNRCGLGFWTCLESNSGRTYWYVLHKVVHNDRLFKSAVQVAIPTVQARNWLQKTNVYTYDLSVLNTWPHLQLNAVETSRCVVSICTVAPRGKQHIDPGHIDICSHVARRRTAVRNMPNHSDSLKMPSFCMGQQWVPWQFSGLPKKCCLKILHP